MTVGSIDGEELADGSQVMVKLQFGLTGDILHTVHLAPSDDISLLSICASEALNLKYQNQIGMCLGTQMLPRTGVSIQGLLHAMPRNVDEKLSAITVDVIRRSGLTASIAKLGDAEHSLRNCAYLSDVDMRKLFPDCFSEQCHLNLNGVCLRVEPLGSVTPGTISLSAPQREYLRCDLYSDTFLVPFNTTTVPLLRQCRLRTPRFLCRTKKTKNDIIRALRALSGTVMNLRQPLVVQLTSSKEVLYVSSLKSIDGVASFGMLDRRTWIDFEP